MKYETPIEYMLWFIFWSITFLFIFVVIAYLQQFVIVSFNRLKRKLTKLK